MTDNELIRRFEKLISKMKPYTPYSIGKNKVLSIGDIQRWIAYLNNQNPHAILMKDLAMKQANIIWKQVKHND